MAGQSEHGAQGNGSAHGSGEDLSCAGERQFRIIPEDIASNVSNSKLFGKNESARFGSRDKTHTERDH